jgi:nucleoside-diphosphate-sugar epimerase
LGILLSKGEHEIRCFDVKNPRNEKVLEKLSGLGNFETIWGDISDATITDKIVQDVECILHLAAIIPPLSEQAPDLAKKVNIGGTHNLIESALKTGKKPKFVFASTVTVHGVRHSTPPPRKADEPVDPTDNYTHSKVASEKELQASGLAWSILRIGAAMPIDILDRDMKSSLATGFGIPLEQRMEVVHPMDVATAFANSVTAKVNEKILYLGGGKDCQMTNGRFQEKIRDAMGIGKLPNEAFRIPTDDSDFWYTDFMDTEESQKLLGFQNHSFENYLEQMKKEFGWRKIFTKLLNPVVKNWMIKQSPYYEENKASIKLE